MSDSLDYTVEQIEDGTWEVWTPDFCGVCIGSGAARTTALRAAADSMRHTITAIERELNGITKSWTATERPTALGDPNGDILWKHHGATELDAMDDAAEQM